MNKTTGITLSYQIKRFAVVISNKCTEIKISKRISVIIAKKLFKKLRFLTQQKFPVIEPISFK